MTTESQQPLNTGPWQPGQDDPARQTDLLDLPERIGRYPVIKPLGRGGFGRVFLAYDDELNRQVAIKTPRLDRIPQSHDIDVNVV